MATRRDETRVILQDGSEALAPSGEVLEGIRQGKWRLPEQDLDGNQMTFMVNDSQGMFEVPSSYLNSSAEDALQATAASRSGDARQVHIAAQRGTDNN